MCGWKRRLGWGAAILSGCVPLGVGCAPTTHPDAGRPELAPAVVPGGATSDVRYAGRPAAWWVARLDTVLARAVGEEPSDADDARPEPPPEPDMADEAAYAAFKTALATIAAAEEEARVHALELDEACTAAVHLAPDTPAIVETLARWLPPFRTHRVHAITDCLEEIGPGAAAAIPALVGVLLAPAGPWDRRQCVACCVGEIGAAPDVVIPALFEAMGDPAFEDGEMATYHPAQLAFPPFGDAVIPHAVAALAAGGRPARGAVLALGVLPAAPPAAVPGLIRALMADDESERRWARSALGAGRPEVIPPVLAALNHAAAERRWEVEAVLVDVGGRWPEAESAIRLAAEGAAPELRERYAVVLARIEAGEGWGQPTGPSTAGEPPAHAAALALMAAGPAQAEAVAALVLRAEEPVCRWAADALKGWGPVADAAVEPLAAGLVTAESPYQIAALIAALGPKGHAALVSALQGEATRRPAAIALAGLPEIPPGALDGLLASLDGHSPAEELVRAVAGFGARAVQPAIAKFRSPASDSYGREGALKVLEALGPRQPAVVLALGDSLTDEYWRVRDVLYTLGRLREGALPVLPGIVACLERPELRVEAVRALAAIGPAARDALPAVRVLADDPDHALRAAVLCARTAFGDPDAIPAAATALPDLPNDLVGSLLRALEAAVALAPELAVPALLATCEPEFDGGRVDSHARWWPSRLPPVAVPALIEAVRSGQGRSTALIVLGHIGPEASAAATVVAEYARKGDALARRTLVAIGGPSVRVLWETLADAPPLELVDRLHEIGQVGPAAAPAVPALLDRLGDRLPEIQEAAISAIVAVGEAAVPGLVRTLQGPDRCRRAGAARALQALRQATPEVLDALRARTSDPDPLVRAAVARAFESLSPDEAPEVPALLRRICAPDPEVRRAVADRAAAMGPAAREMLPALELLLTDSDPTVSAAAERAIRAIRGG